MADLQKFILAIVTAKSELVSGSAPIFIVRDRDALEAKASLLEKILDGIAHDIEDDTMIIVRH